MIYQKLIELKRHGLLCMVTDHYIVHEVINMFMFGFIDFFFYLLGDNTPYLNPQECVSEPADIRYGIPVSTQQHKEEILFDSSTHTINFIPSQTLQYALEPLLYKYKVDLYLGGHTHHYERSYPVYMVCVFGFVSFRFVSFFNFRFHF